MYYRIEGYGICLCTLKVEIHIEEPKTYLFISWRNLDLHHNIDKWWKRQIKNRF